MTTIIQDWAIEPEDESLPLWRAMYTRGHGLFTWWTLRAAGPVEAVELARTIYHQGTLVEVVRAEEGEL